MNIKLLRESIVQKIDTNFDLNGELLKINIKTNNGDFFITSKMTSDCGMRYPILHLDYVKPKEENNGS